VNSFKDEVKSHVATLRAKKGPSNVVELEDGFVVPEGGVFACLCWHEIVEFLIEFVQSAEMYVSAVLTSLLLTAM